MAVARQGVAIGDAVPAAASLTPQTPAEHVRVAHSVSLPGQSVGSWHCGANVVVVLELVVGSVVVVEGAVVVVGAAVVVVATSVLVVVVVGCEAARVSASSMRALHSDSLSAPRRAHCRTRRPRGPS